MAPLKCTCGLASCRTCYQREYTRKRRERCEATPVATPAATSTAPPATPVCPVELDALLSEWRRCNPGSIVQVARNGVTLHVFGDDPMHFDTTDEALEFLTRPRSRAS